MTDEKYLQSEVQAVIAKVGLPERMHWHEGSCGVVFWQDTLTGNLRHILEQDDAAALFFNYFLDVMEEKGLHPRIGRMRLPHAEGSWRCSFDRTEEEYQSTGIPQKHVRAPTKLQACGKAILEVEL